MVIQYEILEEDYISFNILHQERSKHMKRMILIVRCFFSFVFLYTLMLIFTTKKEIGIDSKIIPFCLLFFSLYFIIFTPRYFKYSLKKQTRKLIKEGKNDSILGKKKLEIDNEYIIESDESTETKHKWSVIEKIVETDKYIFIYASAISAYIIPKRIFNSLNEKEAFLQKISELSNLKINC